MSGRWIQNPRNGVARIEPRLAMVDPFDRFLFIMPVMFTAFGFFLTGLMPIQVFVGVALSCLVGEHEFDDLRRQIVRHNLRHYAR